LFIPWRQFTFLYLHLYLIWQLSLCSYPFWTLIK